MTATVSLFDELKKGGYEACLMTTFNVNFSFYEEVLLRRMQASGINHHMLFVDKRMCLAAMLESPPTKAGNEYVLAPMDCSGAFHPKLILLLGKNKGLLAVGSNNVTLSGYGQNLEITNVFEFSVNKNEVHLQLFIKAFDAFKDWFSVYGSKLPRSVGVALDRTTNLCPWITPKSSPSQILTSDYRLLYSANSERSLWQQLEEYLPSNITSVIGLSAFFDTKLAFLDKLTSLSKNQIVLAVQPSSVTAPDELFSDKRLRVVNLDSLTEVNTLNRYAHAKLLYLSGDNNIFISGSANFSEPAWSRNITSGKASNAEAIIVVSGDEAKVLAESLSIANVTSLDTVISNSERKVKRNTESQSSCDLVIIEAQGNSEIHISATERWGVEHRLCYKNDLDLFEPIDSKFHEGSWIIERAIIERNKGRVINVVAQDTVIALIVLIFSDQIINKCTSPKERLLTEAIGSLGTDMPNLSGLLKCFEGMVFTSSETRAHASKKIENNSHEIDPETLIESYSNSIVRVGMSGRHRAVGGDIGLLLDCFIYNIGRRGGIDSTKIFGEDELGRNEEDLIGSEDTAVDYLVDVDISSDKVIDENFQKKMLGLLKRLDTYISSLTNRSKIIENIPVVLSILVLSYTLYQYQKKRKLISKEYLERLNELIFVRVLSESDPLSINEAFIDEFYTSDEWTQFVAYLTWLVYVCGVSFRPPLPVSATIQARDSAIWSNACWLYLAQRLHNDPAAQSLASEYTLAVNDDASIWLTNIISSGKFLSIGETARITNRYSFAQSPAGAFKGFKLVTEVNSQYVKLGGINSKHLLGVFAAGHLTVFANSPAGDQCNLARTPIDPLIS